MQESPRDWHRMCRAEPAEVTALMQYHQAVGMARMLVPRVLLGRKIIEALVERHPMLCQDRVGNG